MRFRNILAAGLMSCAAMSLQAQLRYVRVWQNGESTRLPMADFVYSNGGKTVTIDGTSFATSEVDSITIIHTIYVSYDRGTATVDTRQAPGVTATVDGAYVTITNTTVDEEMEFVVSGATTDGGLLYNGSYKCKFLLNGLQITSKRGAAIDIECGKRIDLILIDGTDNVLTDAAGGTQKAAFYCDGHMEIDGGGSLTVTGNTRHAIATNEYLRLKKGTGRITIPSAVNDGIHAGQYFLMNDGTIDARNLGGDGIQAEITKNPLDEMNGQLFINGGSITLDISAQDVKGIKCDGDMQITGGTFAITASGAGSKGISCPGNMLINQANNSTDITITASGGIYTDPVTEETSRCMGIKVDLDLTIEAGTVTVYNTGSGSRGIKVDGKYTKGAEAVVKASVKN